MRQKTFLGALGVVCLAALAYATSYPFYASIWKGTGSRHNTIEFSINTPSAGAAAVLVPGTDNANALGTSALRFSDLQTMDATIGDDLTVTDRLIPTALIIPTVDIAVASPTYAGQLVKTSAHVVYISSAAVAITNWLKVGAQ